MSPAGLLQGTFIVRYLSSGRCASILVFVVKGETEGLQLLSDNTLVSLSQRSREIVGQTNLITFEHIAPGSVMGLTIIGGLPFLL